MLEVQLGKLAEQKGQNKSVKSFGAMMVKDHSKADEQLKKMASSKNIAIPAMLSDKCQKTLSDFTAKSGFDFDKDYASAMVSGHKDNIDMFKKEAENGKDSAIVQWARGKLPTLEHHLDMAEKTNKDVNK
jgi:putative membrane protein